MTGTFNVRTARGTVHSLTVGVAFVNRGRRFQNRPDVAFGKADCSSITSSAGTVTTDSVDCTRCLDCARTWQARDRAEPITDNDPPWL